MNEIDQSLIYKGSISWLLFLFIILQTKEIFCSKRFRTKELANDLDNQQLEQI